jgi:hypothetical protein
MNGPKKSKFRRGNAKRTVSVLKRNRNGSAVAFRWGWLSVGIAIASVAAVAALIFLCADILVILLKKSQVSGSEKPFLLS